VSTEPVRVFLLDDHEVVRAGVAAMLEAEDDIAVVGGAGTAEDALEGIAASLPDVAVLDVRLTDGSGVEVCREIRSRHPEVKALMLTSFADDRALLDAGMAGASAYVLKQVRGGAIGELRMVKCGFNYCTRNIEGNIRFNADLAGGALMDIGRQLLDPATLRMATERLRDSGELLIEELSPQEQKLFHLIGEGYSNRQIAEELFLAEKTVKNYVSNMLAKLGMARRTEAAALAARLEERQQLREQ